MRSLVASVGTIFVLFFLPGTASSVGVGNADVAALQVALRAANAYSGTIDGWRGPLTDKALVAFQQAVGLDPDGIVGPRTRKAFGAHGRGELGARRLAVGARGWDVAELQFRLAWHGFPSGPFDGVYGPRLRAAVRRFQRFSHLPRLGIAGPRTVAALSRARLRCPLSLDWPVAGELGDGFGPRGAGFHAGQDFLAWTGTPVVAARAGQVVWAGPRGSFGNTVVVAHGRGVRTLYAHLSRIDVDLLDEVAAGTRIGVVGSTGRSTGPHLHFEVRVRGAAVDPMGPLS